MNEMITLSNLIYQPYLIVIMTNPQIVGRKSEGKEEDI